MSHLESERARPVLEKVIRDGRPVLFPPEDVKSVAAFAFKNTIVSSHLDRNSEPFFSASIRTRFRECLEIPFGVQMWIASYGGPHFIGDFNGYVFDADIPSIAEAEFYSFTYVTGYLVLQVLAPRWRRMVGENKSLPVLTPDPIWRSAVTRFWPNFGQSIPWPPELDLSEESLEKFSDRWKQPIIYEV